MIVSFFKFYFNVPKKKVAKTRYMASRSSLFRFFRCNECVETEICAWKLIWINNILQFLIKQIFSLFTTKFQTQAAARSSRLPRRPVGADFLTRQRARTSSSFFYLFCFVVVVCFCSCSVLLFYCFVW